MPQAFNPFFIRAIDYVGQESEIEGSRLSHMMQHFCRLMHDHKAVELWEAIQGPSVMTIRRICFYSELGTHWTPNLWQDNEPGWAD